MTDLKLSKFFKVAAIAATLTFLGACAQTGITHTKFYAGQLFDVQRSPAFPQAGQPFTVWNFIDPFDENREHYTLEDGQFVQIFFVGGSCKNGEVGLALYDAKGMLVRILHKSGHIYGIGPDGFLFVGSNLGTFFSRQPRKNGDSLTYTPTTGPAPETCEALEAYVP